MVLDFTDSLDLLQKVKEQNLFDKLMAQLEKDFALSNVSIDIFPTATPQEVSDVMREKVYYLIMERFDSYLNLLYVVDVPEKAFKEIQVTDAVEVAEQVSFLILKRELQKVWLKAKYA